MTEEFNRALQLLMAGHSIFLTGKAGTGKSTLIRHFMAHNDRRAIVAAPTGIAALNVDGYTIHRLFGFRTTTTLDDVRDGDYRPTRFARTLSSLQTLILDEASMIRADLFDMVITALERFGPQPYTRFGGVQVVLVGDLFQLPPVVPDSDKYYLDQHYQTPYFFSAAQYRAEDFPTVALGTVFRQIGDQRLTETLNAIREGVLVGQSLTDLNARTDSEFAPPEHEFWLTVAPTNRIVTARNRQWLDSLTGSEYVEYASESGDLSLFDPPVESTVRFKVGAQVMLLNNDPGDRWVNGSIGRITAVGADQHGPVVRVELQDGSIVDVRRHTWEATRPVLEDGRLRHEVIGTYTQLPFKLAWAITIHKSQGQTIDRLIVDLTGGTFDYGQVYVALSRCTSLDGLVLRRPVAAKDLKVDRRILRFLSSAASTVERRRYCAIGMLTVGDEGRMSRPRPVEIAVAFDDGTALSTVVNPQRDLARARAEYNINATDVLLAPTLDEVWAVIAPLLVGHTPVGVRADEALGLIDCELKRLGQVTPLPLAVEIPEAETTAAEQQGLNAGSALHRAHAALKAHRRLQPADTGSTAFDLPTTGNTEITYLLTRDPSAAAPNNPHHPTLSTLVGLSQALSAVLLTENSRSAVPPVVNGGSGPLRKVIERRLASAVETVAQLPMDLLDRLRDLDTLLGTDVLGLVQSTRGTTLDIDTVVVPSARVCFTGEAIAPDGVAYTREQMRALAASHGLVPVDSVTKTRCDLLVVAEAGTQSGKARTARKFGKPVCTADVFFEWIARTGQNNSTRA